MGREKPHYRETIKTLYEIFGKHNINLKEYAKYLGLRPETVSNLIKGGVLPGICNGRTFIIPISSIAAFEINNAGKTPTKVYQ